MDTALRAKVTIATLLGALLVLPLPLVADMWTTGTYSYDGAGNIYQMGSDAFEYDKVSRLTSASINRPEAVVSQSYSYDPYGNLTAFLNDPAKQAWEMPNVNVDPSSATNRLKAANGYSYDAAGNTLTTGGGHSYTFDGVNMMTTQSTPGLDYSFLYTADDERIARFEINGTGGVNKVTWTVRGLDNKVLRTYESTGGTTGTDTFTWKKDHVYRGGQLLATIDAQGTKHFHLDHLGTPRLITDSSGEKVSVHTYFPFGAEATAKTQDDESMKFTGHERDSLSDPQDANVLDYLHARYYRVDQARFVSVDPGEDWNPSQPQTWNTYAYTRNGPMINVDPDGRAVDAVVDAASLTYGLVTMWRKALSGQPVTLSDNVAVVADAAALVIPGVTGAGQAVRAASKVDDVVDVARVVDKVDDVADTTRGGKVVAEGALQKPPTGPGTVAKADRDPKRLWTPAERQAKRDAQGGQCANGCGTSLDASNSRGHHKQRHADGGRTDDANHAEVCVDCHKRLHSPR